MSDEIDYSDRVKSLRHDIAKVSQRAVNRCDPNVCPNIKKYCYDEIVGVEYQGAGIDCNKRSLPFELLEALSILIQIVQG
jgi:hypothetical protein